MKKIFTLIIAFMALALPMTAQKSDNKSTSKPIILSSHPLNDVPNPTILRTPMRMSVEAWYDALSETLTVYYDGEATGEVFLYRDGDLIDTSSEINTTFMIPGPGFYTIEITTESWAASGSIDI